MPARPRSAIRSRRNISSITGLGIRGVAATYNRFNYAAEKRAALDLWTAHVAALPAPF